MALQQNAEALVTERAQALASRRCKAITVADALDEADREFYLTEVLPDAKTYSANDVVALLAKEGIPCAPSTISSHRASSHRASSCRCTP